MNFPEREQRLENIAKKLGREIPESHQINRDILLARLENALTDVELLSGVSTKN